MAQRNKQRSAKPKSGAASTSGSRASVPVCGFPGATGKPCQQTILTENGLCRRHADRETPIKTGAPLGNKNAVGHGAPLRNKNALRHGGYETIFVDELDADELAIMEVSEAKTAVAHLREEIALATVRERRMLARIAALKSADLTVVEETVESVASEDDAGPPPDLPDRVVSELSTEAIEELNDLIADAFGMGGKKAVTKEKRRRAGTLGQIQDIEKALTAVSEHKTKLIRTLHAIENPPGALALPPGADEEGAHGLDQQQRADAVAALLERGRAASTGQVPGADS